MATVVEEAAKIIDPEAFSENEWLDGATGKPVDFGKLEAARKKYHQSVALCRAVDVLKLALNTPDLSRQLIENETNGWEGLGIPKSVLATPEVQAIIARKFTGDPLCPL